MKTILLMLVGLLIALVSVNAQQRDDNPNSASTEYRSPDQQQNDAVNQQYKMGWGVENRELVSTEELPSLLKEALQANEYGGLENSSVFRNKTTEDYMLVMNENGSVKTFYFDKTGKYKGDSMNSDRSSSTTTLEPTGTTGSGTTSGTSGYGTTAQEPVQTTQPQNTWRSEDRVMVISDDFPTGLMQTLEDEEYNGWENSTMYKNRNSNEYMIEIRDGSNAKVYYFDKEGKPIH